MLSGRPPPPFFPPPSSWSLREASIMLPTQTPAFSLYLERPSTFPRVPHEFPLLCIFLFPAGRLRQFSFYTPSVKTLFGNFCSSLTDVFCSKPRRVFHPFLPMFKLTYDWTFFPAGPSPTPSVSSFPFRVTLGFTFLPVLLIELCPLVFAPLRV